MENFTGPLLDRLESLCPDTGERRKIGDTKWGSWRFRIYYGSPILLTSHTTAEIQSEPVWTAVGFTAGRGHAVPSIPEDFRCISISFCGQSLASWAYPTRTELLRSLNSSFGTTIVKEYDYVG